MKYVFKSRNKCKHNKVLSKIVFLTFVLIVIFTFFLLHKFNTNINDNLLSISEAEINRLTYSFITDKITNNILNTESMKDLLVITKNNNDEILYVDFNLDKAYKILDTVSTVLTTSLNALEDGEISVSYKDDNISRSTNGMILSIPIGSTLKSTYFYNLGPKIPVRINYIGSVLTNLKTKVTNYGLNNALVEVFVYIELSNQIMTPFKTKNLKLEYDAVIASMMIEGEVPEFYNGSIEKTSENYIKPVEEE